jgi:arylsulfatase A-like enzyme/Tfp pilus assembly protein PilF
MTPVTRRALIAGGGVLLAAACWFGITRAGLWSTGPSGADGRPLNLLIVSIDTIRADRLGSYGYRGARTPYLDALAARGLRFARASTVMPLTLPAHASLLTGTFPAFHGVRDNGGFYLAEEHVTLAESLAGHGYRAGAFVGSFVLDSRWGLDQGFEHYFDNFDLSGPATAALDEIQRPGEEVVGQAIEWLGRDASKPFFAWVHLYDPHTPYAAPASFQSQLPPSLDSAYDAEIAYTDHQIGRLFDHLSASGEVNRTVIVVLGDHGESLGEHQEETHGFFLYDGTLQIPLLIAGPRVPAGTIDDQVRIVDVMPTVLDLLGRPVPPAVQGVSLMPATAGARLDLLAFSETWFPRYHYGWSELMAVGDGRYKFILAPRRELYDLQTDPGEAHDLSDEQRSRADALENALKTMLARVSHSGPPIERQQIDPDAEARLRALGYIGSGSSGRNDAPGKQRHDPKDKVALYNDLRAATADSGVGRVDAAIAKVTRVLSQDPDVVEGHTLLGTLYSKAERYRDAVASYQAALRLDPEHDGAAFSLALAYKNLGDLDAAEAGFQRAKQLDPRTGKVRWQLADISMQRGRFGEAEAELLEALKLTVDRPSFLLKLGECYIEMQRYDQAETRIKAALAEQGRLPLARYDLGLIYEARGQQADAMRAYESELHEHPGTSAASLNLGKLLDAAGRRPEAIARFRESVASSPAFAQGHLYLSKALLDAGDLDGAQRAARRGLELKPEPKIRPLGHYVLADVYNRLGRADDAERQLALARRQ